jgi:hypothetical protein
MRLRVAVLGGLGALATVVAGVFVFAPGAVRGSEPVDAAVGRLAGVDPTLVILAGSVVVGLYVVVSARTGTGGTAGTSGTPDRFAAAIDDPPEAVTADRRRVAGDRVDRTVDRAVETGGRSLQKVRDHLGQTAATAYAERERITVERARAAVADGEWTTDATAAAFLADESGPEPGLGARVRLWLAPERERQRRIERTTDAVDRLSKTESGDDR